MKYLALIGVLLLCLGMWWFQAGVALRKCYLAHVEEQVGNKYTGILTSGLSSERQVELNDVVIDSYPECDQEISQEYYVPSFVLSMMAQAAQK